MHLQPVSATEVVPLKVISCGQADAVAPSEPAQAAAAAPEAVEQAQPAQTADIPAAAEPTPAPEEKAAE